MSSDLQRALREARNNPTVSDELAERLFEEAEEFAAGKKQQVRDALKEKQLKVHRSLTMIDKGKLRSRREARVHRVKEKEFERALKDALRWLIAELAVGSI